MDSDGEYLPSGEESNPSDSDDAPASPSDLMTTDEIAACCILGNVNFKPSKKNDSEPGCDIPVSGHNVSDTGAEKNVVVEIIENGVFYPDDEDSPSMKFLAHDLPAPDEGDFLYEDLQLLPDYMYVGEDSQVVVLDNSGKNCSDLSVDDPKEPIIPDTEDDIVCPQADFELNDPGIANDAAADILSWVPGEDADVSSVPSEQADVSFLIPGEDGDVTFVVPADTPTSKKKKKRDAGEKRSIAKAAREKGQAYTGFRRVIPGSTAKIAQDSFKEARKMGPACVSKQCERRKNRLCGSVSEDERRELFNSFWLDMSWDVKRTFVLATVVDVKPICVSKTPKTGVHRVSSFRYYLRIANRENVPVCQSMYLSTLGLKRSEVRYWLESARQSDSKNSNNQCDSKTPNISGESASLDCDNLNEENLETLTPSTSSASSVRNVKNRIILKQQKTLAEFFDRLPSMPSHYCRKTSSVKYLQADVKSWAQLYRWYQNLCVENNEKPLSKSFFRRERKRRKLAIFQPKKDRCDTCLGFEMGNISEDVYKEHIKRKNDAQMEKEKDKALGQEGMSHVVCFDLMNVQTAPKTRSSSSYYKLKLMLHNFTVYNLSNHDAVCYWWDETEGNLGASVFASCVTDYLAELLTGHGKKPIIMYSDGCNYQNRNYVLANALLHFSIVNDVTITHKYLEKGHTYMEGDSVHSTIETYIKNRDLDLPSQFCTATTEARKAPMPYRAKFLQHTFFTDYGGSETVKYASIRPGLNRPTEPKVTDIRVLQYTPAGHIKFKLDFDQDFKTIPARPKAIDLAEVVFPPLFQSRLKVTKDKFTDLLSMRSVIHSDAWHYYENIPHEEASIRAQKRQNKTEVGRAIGEDEECKKRKTESKTGQIKKKCVKKD